MERDARPDVNALLRQFYSAPQEAAGPILDRLMLACRAQIRATLRPKCGDGDDVDELVEEAVVRLLQALQKSRRPGESRIGDAAAYSRAVAGNVFNDHLRAKRPALYRFKDRVLYLLDGRGGQRLFARWRREADWLGGLSRWRGRPCRATDRYLLFLRDRHAFCQDVLLERDASHVRLPELMARFFPWIGTPLEVDELTGHLAALQCVTDAPSFSLDALTDAPYAERLADPAPDPARQVLDGLAEKSYRARLWHELCELPPFQRSALLFGMERDELLLVAGTAGKLIEPLNLAPQELATVWRELPLADGAIAKRLGVTPKQVSNLRKCARERLARRLARDDA